MPHILKTIASSLAALVTIVVDFPALAQPPAPETIRRELVEAVEAHVDAGRYQLAYDAGIAALGIRADRETFCTTGMIAAQIERFPEAAELLTECINLTTSPPENEQESQRRLAHASTRAMVLTRVATLRILAPALATITVDHRNVGLAPIERDIFVSPNKLVEIHADNFNGQGSATVTIPPGQSKTVLVSIRPAEKPIAREPLSLPLPAPSAPSAASSTSTAFRVGFVSTLTAAAATTSFAVASSIDFAKAHEQLAGVQRRYGCGCECNVQPECTLSSNLRDQARDFRNLAVANGIATGIGVVFTLAFKRYVPIKTAAQPFSIAF